MTVDDRGRDGPSAGGNQGQLGVVPDGAVAIDGAGSIIDLGSRERIMAAFEPEATYHLGGRAVLPGLVDAHTHPVWAGSRVDEFEQRLAGADYVAIAKSGGGIMSTVRATRAASDEELLAGTRRRLDALMAHGATTVEAKTGYGLDTAQELRQLDILGRLAATHPVRLVLTFLGAHAIPEEFQAAPDRYVDLVVEEMLPAVAHRNPGVFVDVFCDDGAFTVAQTRRILEAAKAMGFSLKVHSDEFAHLGCTALAAELGATSADHLVTTTPAEMDAMAASGTVAVLLPGTTFGLGSRHYAAAREMIARGVPVALGTDLNPGTCPCPSLPLIVALATRSMGMSPAEATVAVTRNAAYATGRGHTAGRLAVGRPADLTVLDTDDVRDLAYWFGTNPVERVMIGGRWVVG